MENREAINALKDLLDTTREYPHLDGMTMFGDAIDMAISALEKQIPKKPKHIDKNATFDGNWKRVCPACGRVLVERITTPEKSYPRIYNHTPHCICGQAIDWSEPYMEEENE